ncbi:unnamed protein product, partial [Iphiclides podalirius]
MPFFNYNSQRVEASDVRSGPTWCSGVARTMICISLYALIASATILACVPVCYRQFEMNKFIKCLKK